MRSILYQTIRWWKLWDVKFKFFIKHFPPKSLTFVGGFPTSSLDSHVNDTSRLSGNTTVSYWYVWSPYIQPKDYANIHVSLTSYVIGLNLCTPTFIKVSHLFYVYRISYYSVYIRKCQSNARRWHVSTNALSCYNKFIHS